MVRSSRRGGRHRTEAVAGLAGLGTSCWGAPEPTAPLQLPPQGGIGAALSLSPQLLRSLELCKGLKSPRDSLGLASFWGVEWEGVCVCVEGAVSTCKIWAVFHLLLDLLRSYLHAN